MTMVSWTKLFVREMTTETRMRIAPSVLTFYGDKLKSLESLDEIWSLMCSCGVFTERLDDLWRALGYTPNGLLLKDIIVEFQAHWPERFLELLMPHEKVSIFTRWFRSGKDQLAFDNGTPTEAAVIWINDGSTSRRHLGSFVRPLTALPNPKKLLQQLSHR